MARFDFDGRENRSGRRKLGYATLLVLVLFALDLLSGGSVRALAQRAMSSVWVASAQMRSGIFESGYFASRGSLARENASLRELVAKNTEKASAYETLREENVLLRSLLSLSNTESGITAPIVSSVRSSPYGTFLVGAGAGDNLKTGSLVLTEGGFVVGSVSEVREHTTLVTEVFAGGSHIDVSIHGAVAGAEGRGGGNARVQMPRGIEVREGDPVIAPQLGGRPIGLVGKVESDSSSADQTVFVHLPINLSALRYVYIVPAE